MGKRTILLLFVAIIAIMTIGGCQSLNQKNNISLARALNYLHTKYQDDKFEYSGSQSPGFGLSTQWLFTSEKFPDKTFLFEYYRIDGEECFSDGYLSVKYEESVRQVVQELLDEVFSCETKCYVYLRNNGPANVFIDNTTFEQYIADPESSIRFAAVISPELVERNSNAIGDAVKAAVAKRDIVISGDIFFPNNMDDFQNWDSIANPKMRATLALVFTMSDLYTFDQFEWMQ